MPIRDIIVVGIVLGAVPYIFQRPWLGVIMWSWVSYMNPHRYCWGFAYNFPVAQIAAISLLASMLLSKERKRLPWHWLMPVWFAFIFWMCFTTLFAVNPSGAWNEWDREMKIQLIAIITVMLITNRERVNALVGIIVFSIGFYGVKGGIFSLLTGLQYSIGGPPGSFIEGNNEIGLGLLMIMPLMWYLSTQTSSKLLKLVLVASMLFCLVGVVSTYSRGAFLAMAAMSVSLVWKSRQRGTMLILVVLALPFAISLAPQKWFDRMGTIQTYEEDGSAMGRINAWTFAYNLAKDRPFVGGGFRAFTRAAFQIWAPNPADHHDAHSIYFEVLGEQGFVGLALFLTLFIGAYLTSASLVRRTRHHPDLKWVNDLCRMLQVCYVSYAVGGAFLGLAYFDLPYHLIGLTIICHAIVAEQLRNAATVSPGSTRRPAAPVGGRAGSAA